MSHSQRVFPSLSAAIASNANPPAFNMPVATDLSSPVADQPSDLPRWFPRTPAEINKIIEASIRDPPVLEGFDDTDKRSDDGDDVAADKIIQDALGENTDAPINNKQEPEESEDELPEPPDNLPDNFPSNFWDPYQSVPAPDANAVTSEFEAAFEYKPAPQSPIRADGNENGGVSNDFVHAYRERMTEVYSGMNDQDVDVQFRKFMDELKHLGEPPVYEDSFAELTSLNSGLPIVGKLAAELDDDVDELGDFAANPALFDEFAQLLQPDAHQLQIDTKFGPRKFEDEWAELEREVEGASTGKLDFVGDVLETKRVLNNLLEEDIEISEEGDGYETRNKVDHPLMGNDPVTGPYVFEKENELVQYNAEDALVMGEKFRIEEVPERAVDAFEAALNPVPGREELSDEKRAWAWYKLGLIYAEQGDSYRAIQCLQLVVNLARARGDLELGEKNHPLRLAAKASVELAILYGDGINTRVALSHIRRWLSFATEIWGEDFAMDKDEILDEDDELAITDGLRQRVRKVLERHIGDPDALKAVSLLHTLARDMERAKDALHGVADVCTTDPLAWSRLADGIGMTEDALRARRKVVDLRPSDPRPWALVGQTYMELGQHEKAAPYLLRALAMDDKAREESEEKMTERRRTIRAQSMADAWSSLAVCVWRLEHDELGDAVERKEFEPFRAYFNF